MFYIGWVGGGSAASLIPKYKNQNFYFGVFDWSDLAVPPLFFLGTLSPEGQGGHTAGVDICRYFESKRG